MINLIIMAKALKPFSSVDHLTKNNFLQGVIAAPARRGLELEKIDSLDKLADYSEQEIMKFHGFGKNTMIKLKKYMKENNRSFNTHFSNNNYEK